MAKNFLISSRLQGFHRQTLEWGGSSFDSIKSLAYLLVSSTILSSKLSVRKSCRNSTGSLPDISTVHPGEEGDELEALYSVEI